MWPMGVGMGTGVLVGQVEGWEDWQFDLLTLFHPCRARMVLRVTAEKMESQDSL